MERLPTMSTLNTLSRGFTAGAVGAVANVIFVILAGTMGLIAAMGIALPAPPMPEFLYKQIVWGGLFGLLFAVPFVKGNWVLRGLVIGLIASLVLLFIFLPKAGAGIAGLNAGTMTPVLVLIANSVWGLVAAWFYERLAR
jgi:hypothetical protein